MTQDNHHGRVVRYIQPLGLRVLVRVLPDAERHESGLYLPPGSQQKLSEALYGEVVEVARAAPDDANMGANVSGIPHGARILFPKDKGIKVPWADDLRLLDTSDVLAKVDEVAIEDTH